MSGPITCASRTRARDRAAAQPALADHRRNGRLQEVRGPGVVGEEPVLKPGQSFEYTSACPLATPSGMMVGDYEMETPAGEKFLIRVPAFSLDSPQETRRLN
jgi:ApaG protein